METDRDLVQAQYRDASNLAARAAIYRFAHPTVTPWPRWVFDQLARGAETAAAVFNNVLEIGCGDGGLWKRNLDRLLPAWRVTMLDLSPGMLLAARRELPPAQFTFVQSDAASLPFADARFNAVVANHMLYHLRDRDRGLRELRRVLAAGGRLFATTNSELHLGPLRRLINEFLGDACPLLAAMPFSMENGGEQIRAAGFNAVDPRLTRGELRVTDAEAVVRYVMSVSGAPETIVGEKLDELRRRAADEIERNGAFILPTAAGLFVARP